MAALQFDFGLEVERGRHDARGRMEACCRDEYEVSMRAAQEKNTESKLLGPSNRQPVFLFSFSVRVPARLVAPRVHRDRTSELCQL